MCGVAGIIWSGSIAPQRDAAQAMAQSIRHRGPDDMGVTHTPGADLAHTRLCIVDPAGGAQPMSHEPTGQTLSFNGEIYNHRALRADLQRRGNRFQGHSDTEALLLSLVEHGSAALNYLNGQFAFIHWDERNQRLLAARDRLGEKPLYYATDPQGRLILGSEIKAILASGLIRPKINPAAVRSCLTLMHSQPHETVYREIHALPPGCMLTWQRGQLSIEPYWQPKYGWRDDITRDEAVKHTRRLIEQAVDRQRIADVTVGSFLSGGLDSSTLTAILAQQQDTQTQAFAVGFGSLIDELPYARSVAEAYPINHHELQLADAPVAELLTQMTRVYDEPFADSSWLPTYLISQFAAKHVKSVIGGDGADELFGGYGWTRSLLMAEQCETELPHRMTRWSKRQGWRVLNKLNARFAPNARQAAQRWAAGQQKRAQPDPWKRHLANDTWARPNDIAPRFHPPADLVGIDRATDYDLRVYLPGDILTKVDRAAMAHGLETRAPFLDHDLVEFVLSLPTHIRFEVGRSKPLLRDACQDLWPDKVRARGKQGFGAPVKHWLDQPDVQALRDKAAGRGSAIESLFDGSPPIKIDDADPQARWRLLSVGLWLNEHADAIGQDKEQTEDLPTETRAAA